jgi:hypothetical protein
MAIHEMRGEGVYTRVGFFKRLHGFGGVLHGSCLLESLMELRRKGHHFGADL